MKKKYLTLLIIFMLFPISYVSAGSMSVSVSCADITVGGTTTCTVKGQANGTSISSVSARVSISGATYVSSSMGSGFSGASDKTSIDVYTDKNKKGSFVIATYTLKGNSAGTGKVSVTGIVASDSDFNELNVKSATKSFKIKAKTVVTTQPKTTKITTKPVPTTKKTNPITTNPIVIKPTTPVSTEPETVGYGAVGSDGIAIKLDTLKVDDFNVRFESGIYYVDVKAETEEVNISATANKALTVIGLGKRNIISGSNKIELIIRNQMNQTAIATIMINRPTYADAYDTKLTSLSVVNYKLDFRPDVLSYDLKVPYNVKEIFVVAESNEKNTITGAGVVKLENNTKDVKIKVSYENSTSTTYTIHVKKEMNMTFIWIGIGILLVGLTGGLVYAFTRKKKADDAKEKEFGLGSEIDKMVGEKGKSLELGKETQIQNIPTPTVVNPIPQAPKVVVPVQTNKEGTNEPVQIGNKTVIKTQGVTPVKVQNVQPVKTVAVATGVKPQVVKKVVSQPQVKVVTNANNKNEAGAAKTNDLISNLMSR